MRKLVILLFMLAISSTNILAADKKVPWVHTCGETDNYASLTEESMLVFMSALAVDDTELAMKLIDNDLVFTLKKNVTVLITRPPDPKTLIFKGRIKGEAVMIYSMPLGWCAGE